MLTLNVEFSAGEDITDAFQEALDLANKLQCCVSFKFNDVRCTATPGGLVRRGVASWDEALKSKSPYKFARTN